MNPKHRIRITVNGRQYEHEVEPRLLLVHYLREVLGLDGTRVGCDTSNCGCCTIQMDGRAVKSCTVLAVQADGHEITTVEGLLTEGRLNPVQEAFWEEHALQCGFCTSGMVMSAQALLQENPEPDDRDIRLAIEGNLCRCTGYLPIVSAIRRAAASMRERR